MTSVREMMSEGHDDDSSEMRKEGVDTADEKTATQCVFMLVSTALGGGVLTMAYMIRLSGCILGSMIAVWAGLMALLGMDILMRATVQDGCESFAKLLAYHTGPKSQPLLDAMLSIYGNGSMIAYFIFLGDFLPKLMSDFGATAGWLLDRPMLLGFAALLVLPVTLQKKMGILAKITPIALLALAYTSVVIFVKAPGYYKENHAKGESPAMTVMSWNIFKATSICIFAYNCHMNVVPVACRLKEPSRKRIIAVCSAAVAIQAVFYVLIAVSGYLSFMSGTQQDILQSFPHDDGFLAVSRFLLTCSILVGIPVNDHPTIQSTVDCIRYFTRPANSPLLSPNSAQAQAPPNPWLRSVIAVLCVFLQFFMAWKVPKVAAVISLLGATCGTVMMFVIPAIVCYKKIKSGKEDTTQARVSVVMFILATLVSCIGIVVLFLEFGGVLPTQPKS